MRGKEIKIRPEENFGENQAVFGYGAPLVLTLHQNPTCHSFNPESNPARQTLLLSHFKGEPVEVQQR